MQLTLHSKDKVILKFHSWDSEQDQFWRKEWAQPSGKPNVGLQRYFYYRALCEGWHRVMLLEVITFLALADMYQSSSCKGLLELWWGRSDQVGVRDCAGHQAEHTLPLRAQELGQLRILFSSVSIQHRQLPLPNVNSQAAKPMSSTKQLQLLPPSSEVSLPSVFSKLSHTLFGAVSGRRLLLYITCQNVKVESVAETLTLHLKCTICVLFPHLAEFTVIWIHSLFPICFSHMVSELDPKCTDERLRRLLERFVPIYKSAPSHTSSPRKLNPSCKISSRDGVVPWWEVGVTVRTKTPFPILQWFMICLWFSAREKVQSSSPFDRVFLLHCYRVCDLAWMLIWWHLTWAQRSCEVVFFFKMRQSVWC